MVDYRVVANEIIEQNNATKNHDSMRLTCKRLIKLVLLTEIEYMKKHNKPLISADYEFFPNNSGLIMFEVYYSYLNGLSECIKVNGGKNIMPSIATYNEIKEIVQNVLEVTKNVETSDLIEALKIKLPEQYCNRRGISNPDKRVPKNIIYKHYISFKLNDLTKHQIKQ